MIFLLEWLVSKTNISTYFIIWKIKKTTNLLTVHNSALKSAGSLFYKLSYISKQYCPPIDCMNAADNALHLRYADIIPDSTYADIIPTSNWWVGWLVRFGASTAHLWRLPRLRSNPTERNPVKRCTLGGLHVLNQPSSPKFQNFCRVATVPDHDGGQPKQINAWFLYTHMVYL